MTGMRADITGMRADITAIASIQKEIAAMNASSNVSESGSGRVEPPLGAAAVLALRCLSLP
jgi:hypothetical protein